MIVFASQSGDDAVRFVTYASVGITTGEGVRLSMANPKNSGGSVMMRSGVVQFALMDGSVRPVKVHVWREVVNNQTGSTKGGNYFTGTVTVSGEGWDE